MLLSCNINTLSVSDFCSTERENNWAVFFFASQSLNLTNSIPSTSTGKSPVTPQTPKTPSGAGKTPKTPPGTPDLYPNGYYEDDLDSVHSYSSGRSTMSCEHAYVAR